MSSLLPQSAPPRCDSPTPTHITSSSSRADAARPFTASAARSSGLLVVHVHCGEHLDALAATAPSSFVVASIGTHGGDCVECWSSAAAAAATRSVELPSSAVAAIASNDDVLYTQRYSPFAATRVVERSCAPVWNELLALALPFEWRGDKRQSAAPLKLALTLELVQRGASQQEDFLLATALVPLQCVACHQQQVRLALQFPSAHTAAASLPQIFVSLRESARDCAATTRTDRLEVLVERFAPAESSDDAATATAPPTPQSEALALAVAVAPPPSALLSEYEQLAQLFAVAENQSRPTECAVHRAVDVTPFARRQSSSSGSCGAAADGVFAWHFPLVFELESFAGDGTGTATRELELALYDTASDRRRVGSGRIALPPQLRLSTDSGAATEPYSDARFTPCTPVAVFAESSALDAAASRVLLGHVHVSVRWWSPAAWTSFARAAPSRRVVSSNRSVGKSSALLALEWTGALLRGLNRYPVSSFCDEGGVSSVLARFLAASSSPPPPAMPPGSEQAMTAAGDAHVSAVLATQLTHLQTESAAQRQQIDRLQTELDARLRAVQTCGKELVALRREVRAKDQVVRELRAEREQIAAREREQMAQLAAAAATAPVSANASGPMASRTQEQLALVLAKYTDLEQRYRETRAQLDAAAHSLELARDLETRYSELEHAHVVQAAHVQRLQRDKQLVVELKRTVRLQEKVIRQFEAAVGREAADEEEERASQRSASSSSSRMPTAAQSDIADIATHSCSDALLAVRVRVLEEQLATNARAAASEIGRLQLRVLELEAARNEQHD